MRHIAYSSPRNTRSNREVRIRGFIYFRFSGFPVHTKTYSVVNEVKLSLTAIIDIWSTQKGKLSRNNAIVSQFFWRCDRDHALILILMIQGSKLTLANSQNVSDFDNLRVRKISTSKRLRVRIIHVSQTKGNNLLVVSPVC